VEGLLGLLGVGYTPCSSAYIQGDWHSDAWLLCVSLSEQHKWEITVKMQQHMSAKVKGFWA
jgi:hypothetical protein